MSFITDLLKMTRAGSRFFDARDSRLDREYNAELAEQLMTTRGARSSALSELASNPELDLAGLTQGVIAAQESNPMPEIDFSRFKTNPQLEKWRRIAESGGGEKDIMALLKAGAGEVEGDRNRAEAEKNRTARALLSGKGKDKFPSSIKTETFGDIAFNPEPQRNNPRNIKDEDFENQLRMNIRQNANEEDQARWLNPDNSFTEEGKKYKERTRELYKFRQVSDVRDAGIVAALEQGISTEAKVTDVPAGEVAGDTGDAAAVEELRGKIQGIAANLLKNPEFDRSNPEHTKMVAESVAEKTGRNSAEILAMLMAFLEGDE